MTSVCHSSIQWTANNRQGRLPVAVARSRHTLQWESLLPTRTNSTTGTKSWEGSSGQVYYQTTATLLRY